MSCSAEPPIAQNTVASCPTPFRGTQPDTQPRRLWTPPNTPAQQLEDLRCSASLALFRDLCKWSVVVLLVGPKGKIEIALLSVFCNHICASTSRGKTRCKKRTQKPPRHCVPGERATKCCVREIRISFEISDTMVQARSLKMKIDSNYLSSQPCGKFRGNKPRGLSILCGRRTPKYIVFFCQNLTSFKLSGLVD